MSQRPIYESDSSEPPHTTDEEADEYTPDELAQLVKNCQLDKLHQMQTANRKWKKKHVEMIPLLVEQLKCIIIELFYDMKQFITVKKDYFVFHGRKFDLRLIQPYVYVHWNNKTKDIN